MLQACLDLLGVAASRESAADFLLTRQLVRAISGALTRRRYGEFPWVDPHLGGPGCWRIELNAGSPLVILTIAIALGCYQKPSWPL